MKKFSILSIVLMCSFATSLPGQSYSLLSPTPSMKHCQLDLRIEKEMAILIPHPDFPYLITWLEVALDDTTYRLQAERREEGELYFKTDLLFQERFLNAGKVRVRLIAPGITYSKMIVPGKNASAPFAKRPANHGR